MFLIARQVAPSTTTESVRMVVFTGLRTEAADWLRGGGGRERGFLVESGGRVLFDR